MVFDILVIVTMVVMTMLMLMIRSHHMHEIAGMKYLLKK